MSVSSSTATFAHLQNLPGSYRVPTLGWIFHHNLTVIAALHSFVPTAAVALQLKVKKDAVWSETGQMC